MSLPKFYAVVPAAFAIKNKGHKKGENHFITTETTDKRAVCAVTSINEFPEIFDGETITIASLEQDAFPKRPKLT